MALHQQQSPRPPLSLDLCLSHKSRCTPHGLTVAPSPRSWHSSGGLLFSRLPCCEVMKASKLGHVVRSCSPWDTPGTQRVQPAPTAHTFGEVMAHVPSCSDSCVGRRAPSLPCHGCGCTGLAWDWRLSLGLHICRPPRQSTTSNGSFKVDVSPAFLSLPFPFIFSPLYFFLLTTGTRTCFHEVPSAV